MPESLDPATRVNIVLGMMRSTRTYLRWGIFVAGSGFVISMVVTIGLLTGFMVPLILSSRLWCIPFGLLIISSLCIVASIALLVIGLTFRIRK